MVGQNPPHTYRKDGIFYYCRRIPKDLLSRYDETRIVMSLRTKSSKAAGRSAAAITSRLDEYWMSLRIADLQIPSIIFGTNHHDRHAAITLSEALDKYHALRGMGKDELFFRASSRFVKYAIEELGDRNVADYSSLDAAKFRDHLFERGLSSSSVKRTFSSIRSIVNFAIRENGLSCPNAFSNTFVPDKDDQTRRIPIPADCLKKIQAECVQIDDEKRWLIALISDSGMRLAEAAGLLKTDLVLNCDYPHVDLKPHKWRQLKTKNSTRKIPLIGSSLWAAKRILDQPCSPYAFPRYVDGVTCNSNSASAALNKWMRPMVPQTCVVHSFRHSFRDRLREAETPTEITDVLGGWACKSIGQQYGNGFDLKRLSCWMNKIL
jgi:integrase